MKLAQQDGNGRKKIQLPNKALHLYISLTSACLIISHLKYNLNNLQHGIPLSLNTASSIPKPAFRHYEAQEKEREIISTDVDA